MLLSRAHLRFAGDVCNVIVGKKSEHNGLKLCLCNRLVLSRLLLNGSSSDRTFVVTVVKQEGCISFDGGVVQRVQSLPGLPDRN
ncbi:MAG: hypothetical protein QME52_13795 [Bacteroidota bacterium]|nr:hypothetical protein [Bacteroidota bacterium]